MFTGGVVQFHLSLLSVMVGVWILMTNCSEQSLTALSSWRTKSAGRNESLMNKTMTKHRNDCVCTAAMFSAISLCTK
jgi:hypothetical protein